jgi:hypothetical protein
MSEQDAGGRHFGSLPSDHEGRIEQPADDVSRPSCQDYGSLALRSHGDR